MTKSKSKYAEYAFLRSVCETFSERLLLGHAISNGWTAQTLSALGSSFFDGSSGVHYRPKEHAFRQAILIAATKLHVGGMSVYAMPWTDEEQQKRDQERVRECERLRAQWPAPPPVIPEHGERVRLNRLICPTPGDREALENAFRAGWSPKALDDLARHRSLFGFLGKRAAMREAIEIAGHDGNTEYLNIREKHRLRTSSNDNNKKHANCA